jgi:ketosteroid isomerase-like protein
MTNSQSTESLARRCIELFNKRTFDWVDTCYAENVEWFELPLSSTPSGQHGDRAFLRDTAKTLLSLFPDRQMTIANLVAKEDCVAMELQWRGTAAASIGPLRTGSKVHFRVASFLTIRDGLIIKQVDYCVPIPSGAA